MKVFVKTLSQSRQWTTTTLVVLPTDTVESLKNKFHSEEGCDVRKSFNYNGEALCEKSTLAECSIEDSASLFFVEPAELVFSSEPKEETGNGELAARDVQRVTEVEGEEDDPCVNVLVSFSSKVQGESDVDTQSKPKKGSFPLGATKVSFPHVDTQSNRKKKVSFPLRATKSLAAKGPEKDPPGSLLLSIASKVLPKSESDKHSNKKKKVSFSLGRTNVDNVPDPSAEVSLWEKIRMAKSSAERAEKKLAAKVPENFQVVRFLTSVKDALKFRLKHRRFFLAVLSKNICIQSVDSVTEVCLAASKCVHLPFVVTTDAAVARVLLGVDTSEGTSHCYFDSIKCHLYDSKVLVVEDLIDFLKLHMGLKRSEHDYASAE